MPTMRKRFTLGTKRRADECFVCDGPIDAEDYYLLVPSREQCDGRILPKIFAETAFTVCGECHAYRDTDLQRIGVYAALTEAAREWETESN